MDFEENQQESHIWSGTTKARGFGLPQRAD
jgi:hypothetical protein